MSRLTQLREDNAKLKHQLHEITTKNEKLSTKLKTDIDKFTADSRSSLQKLNAHVIQETSQSNKMQHQLTVKYQKLLRTQIDLLNQNKDLVNKRQDQDGLVEKKLDQLTAGYEAKIAHFNTEVQANAKKIGQIQGSGLVRKLLLNSRFRAEVEKRGGDPDKILAQLETEKIIIEIKERTEEIELMEQSNTKIDAEVGKMTETLDAFKQLLENMTKEKDNITQQNEMLKEKLTRSQQLLMKYLPQSS